MAPASAGPYLLIDADSGKVIVQSDAGRPWYPASVTKLMTTYLTFQAMRAGKVQSDTLLIFTANAVAQPPSKMGFQAGTQVTVDNALKMLMVKSANDIAVVLAEGIGGNLDEFIAEMNRTAARLGMTGTRFSNPNGLPDENQFTTARDMAILARAIIHEFPEYEMYFRIPALRIGKKLLRNHNKLIDRYLGADGMKTGFICSSGFNMVASAKRGDKRLIAVVFGAFSASQRSEDAAKLFERGFGRKISIAGLFGRELPELASIVNASGNPADLREDMCNRKKKRPAAESDIEDDEPEAEPAPANMLKRLTSKGKQSLLAELPASMPPIRVFVGPSPKMPEVKNAATLPAKGKATRTASAAVSPAKSNQSSAGAGAIVPAALAADKTGEPSAGPGAIPRTAQAFAAQEANGARNTNVAAIPPRSGKLPVHVPLPRPRPKI